MPDITIRWGNDAHTVVHITYGKNWTWHDFQQTDQIALSMLESVEHRVDFLLDVSQGKLPTDLLTKFPSLASSVTGVSHPRAGRIALVGADHYLRLLWGIFERVYPGVAAKVITCPTLEEAYSQLGATPAADDPSP